MNDRAVHCERKGRWTHRGHAEVLAFSASGCQRISRHGS